MHPHRQLFDLQCAALPGPGATKPRQMLMFGMALFNQYTFYEQSRHAGLMSPFCRKRAAIAAPEIP